MSERDLRLVEAYDLYLSHRSYAGALSLLDEQSSPYSRLGDVAKFKYDENLANSADHLRQNWDFIVTDAIAEAESHGKAINYPPYTE